MGLMREEDELQININLKYIAIYIGDQTPCLESLSLYFHFLSLYYETFPMFSVSGEMYF